MKGDRQMFKKKKSSRNGFKLIAMSFAAFVLMLGIIGGSLAWLVAKTDPIVNVFTYGGIQITLTETTGTGSGIERYYKMTPGKTLAKDPTLTVEAGSEDCWLYVKIDESSVERLSDYIEYTVADGWTALDGVSGVYYRPVNSSDVDVSYGILKDDCVTVKGSVTADMLAKLDNTNYPKLTFTGYAVQRDATIPEIASAASAWSLVSGN